MKWIVRAEWISYDRTNIRDGSVAKERDDSQPMADWTADTWLVEADGEASAIAAIAAIAEPWGVPPTDIRAWRSGSESPTIIHVSTDRAHYWRYKPQTKKARTERLQAAALNLLRYSDWTPEQAVDLRTLAPAMAEASGCHIETARRHLAKAERIMRGQHVAKRGGKREGAGRPPTKSR